MLLMREEMAREDKCLGLLDLEEIKAHKELVKNNG